MYSAIKDTFLGVTLYATKAVNIIKNIVHLWGQKTIYGTEVQILDYKMTKPENITKEIVTYGVQLRETVPMKISWFSLTVSSDETDKSVSIGLNWTGTRSVDKVKLGGEPNTDIFTISQLMTLPPHTTLSSCGPNVSPDLVDRPDVPSQCVYLDGSTTGDIGYLFNHDSKERRPWTDNDYPNPDSGELPISYGSIGIDIVLRRFLNSLAFKTAKPCLSGKEIYEKTLPILCPEVPSSEKKYRGELYGDCLKVNDDKSISCEGYWQASPDDPSVYICHS